MGLFRRLLGANNQPRERRPNQRPAWMRDGMQVQLYEGSVDLEVVGESHYQDNLWRLVGRPYSPDDRVRVEIHAVLVAEIDNPYDANAVSVWVRGLKVGHLSRDNAVLYRSGLLALERRHGMPIALSGVIAGGGMREDGPGRLGVFLRHDPADFGLPSAPASPEPRMRTGLSDALATDAADDTYDLSWMNDLPTDNIRAITKLRQLLERDSDPIDRHFMYAHLEALLYQSREAFASALDDYDEVCRRHDAEMDRIRDAFVAKWGQVPLLETYRQQAIRQHKAKDLERALWWAQRGIAIYEGDAARPEAVEDLQKRAATYRAKLQPKQPRPPSPKVPRSSPQLVLETLTCATCGRAFQRTRARGRKPLHCPECRNQSGM